MSSRSRGPKPNVLDLLGTEKPEKPQRKSASEAPPRRPRAKRSTRSVQLPKATEGLLETLGGVDPVVREGMPSDITGYEYAALKGIPYERARARLNRLVAQGVLERVYQVIDPGRSDGRLVTIWRLKRG